MFLRVKQFSNGKPILFGSNMMRTPFSVGLNGADIQPNADSVKLVPEGSFIADVGGKVRFLPRTKVGAAVTTASPTVTLAAPSFSFQVGDVLYAVAGYGQVAFTGTFTASDVYTISVDSVSYSVTAPASPTAATVAAAFVTANATALLAAGVTVTQIASTGTLLFRANDAYKVDLSSSSGSVQLILTSTEAGYLGDCLVPLGTIQSVGGADASGTRIVTLAANAAYALPSGCSVGVRATEILGLYPENLDFTQVPMEHIAPICEADGVYEQNLPYVDKYIKRKLRDLRIYKRFYQNV